LTEEKVVIFHTNDLHSHFENLPKIRRYILSARHALAKKQVKTLTVDLGDAMDRVHPYTEVTDGQINVKLMNQIGYDAVTIGNNEGIGNSHEQLAALYQNAVFPVIVDNLIDRRTNQRPSWAKKYRIVQTACKTKIALIACTVPFAATYDMNDWQALPIDQILPDLLAEVTPQADLIILLSHLGINVDRQIAKKYPQIKIILGSHTHHLLPQGEWDEQALLCAAGKWGEYVGRVDLEISNHQLTSAKAQVIATDELPEAVGDQNEIANYQQTGENLLQQFKVAWLPKELHASLIGSSELTRIGLKSVEKLTKTQLAILNGGLFLGDLPQGIITRNDLHRVLPHPMRIVKVRLNGYNFWRLIREMEKNRNHLRRAFVKGNGFRGKIFGELVYGGISYDPVSKEVFANQQPLDLGKDYEIGMVDNFIYCPYFPTLEIAGHATYWGDRFLRDVIGDYLAQEYPIKNEG
jgi:2',3'-cyclic-nucleotide 2'-phosphodiesterase (5'-nucleotidase family)